MSYLTYPVSYFLKEYTSGRPSFMQLQKIIEQLGYTPKEVKVYLTALSLGSCTISDISKKIKLPRTSVQIIVDILHEKGLMSFYVKSRYRYWLAENPQRLMTGLREREAALQSIMPALSILQHDGGVKPVVKIFTGPGTFPLVLNDIIDTHKNIQSIISWNEWMQMVGNETEQEFIDRRVKHFLSVRLLIPKTVETEEIRKRDTKEMRQTRFYSDHFAEGMTIFIYGTKVVIISLNKKEITGIMIDDISVSKIFLGFFEELWGHSS